MNLTMTVMALCAFGIGLLIACRLKAWPTAEGGRADRRDPGLSPRAT
jgi:hypothetical protein